MRVLGLVTYGSISARPFGRLQLQGDLFVVNSRFLFEVFSDVARFSRWTVEPRAGASVRLGRGTVARLAYQNWSKLSTMANTLAPITTSGTPLADWLLPTAGALRDVIGQVSHEWAGRVFIEGHARRARQAVEPDSLGVVLKSLKKFDVSPAVEVAQKIRGLALAHGVVDTTRLDDELQKQVRRSAGLDFYKIDGLVHDWGVDVSVRAASGLAMVGKYRVQRFALAISPVGTPAISAISAVTFPELAASATYVSSRRITASLTATRLWAHETSLAGGVPIADTAQWLASGRIGLETKDKRWSVEAGASWAATKKVERSGAALFDSAQAFLPLTGLRAREAVWSISVKRRQ